MPRALIQNLRTHGRASAAHHDERCVLVRGTTSCYRYRESTSSRSIRADDRDHHGSPDRPYARQTALRPPSIRGPCPFRAPRDRPCLRFRAASPATSMQTRDVLYVLYSPHSSSDGQNLAQLRTMSIKTSARGGFRQNLSKTRTNSREDPYGLESTSGSLQWITTVGLTVSTDSFQLNTRIKSHLTFIFSDFFCCERK